MTNGCTVGGIGALRMTHSRPSPRSSSSLTTVNCLTRSPTRPRLTNPDETSAAECWSACSPAAVWSSSPGATSKSDRCASNSTRKYCNSGPDIGEPRRGIGAIEDSDDDQDDDNPGRDAVGNPFDESQRADDDDKREKSGMHATLSTHFRAFAFPLTRACVRAPEKLEPQGTQGTQGRASPVYLCVPRG